LEDKSALEAVGLGKSFGMVEALKNLDLAIEPGCFFGLLGPNGD
jgi:ABC-type multidrug transport system ATPase subunit